MDLLPEECIDLIVSYLDIISLTRLGLSSKRLKASCFSLRYWTHVDCSTINGNNITSELIKKLSSFATSLQILNIQNCPNVNLESLVPLVFSFKELELIKHDGEHRLLDETVAINRMLQKADQLLNRYDYDKFHVNEERQRKFDNAARQARALIWDALFIVVANKQSKHYPEENYFQNVHHPQETLDRVTKTLRETEKMLGQSLKLWPNTLACKTAIKNVTFVTDPRSDKIYLACGVSGEIVLWDMDTRTVFKVFNYLDSLEQVTVKKATKVQYFISVLVFSHLDRLMIFGGTSRGGVCWDFDTCQIVYEMKLPRKEDDPQYRGTIQSKYYALNWGMKSSQTGFIELYDGGPMAFFFELGTGQIKQSVRIPLHDARETLHSSKCNGLVLRAYNADEVYHVTVIDLETQQEKQILKLLPSPHADDFSGYKKFDWYNDQLIAIRTKRGIEIYKNQSDTDHQYELHVIIDQPKQVTKVKFLSEKLLLVDGQIFDVDTGDIVIRLEYQYDSYSMSRTKWIDYSPELDIIVRPLDVQLVIYDLKTKQKTCPETTVPLSSFTKLDNETLLLYDSRDIHPYNRSYAKLSLIDCKVIETVEIPWQILDVSADGKYVLALDNPSIVFNHYVAFVVFELDTKQVIFRRKFLQDHASATWSVSAIGRFMPQHSDRVLLSHPKFGFQIFDLTSGKVLQDYSKDYKCKCVDNHITISPDERFVVLKSAGVVVDLEAKKTLTLKDRSTSSRAVAFNPTNPKQLVVAGQGVSVLNLPNLQREFYLTRYLDGLVETIRESEKVAFLKFSPNGMYLAVVDAPSPRPWGLEIANTLIRVYETTTFTQVSSFDTGGHARALYWLDNERALIGMINGELMTLQLVVEEYKSLFDYIVPSKIPKSKSE